MMCLRLVVRGRKVHRITRLGKVLGSRKGYKAPQNKKHTFTWFSEQILNSIYPLRGSLNKLSTRSILLRDSPNKFSTRSILLRGPLNKFSTRSILYMVLSTIYPSTWGGRCCKDGGPAQQICRLAPPSEHRCIPANRRGSSSTEEPIFVELGVFRFTFGFLKMHRLGLNFWLFLAIPQA